MAVDSVHGCGSSPDAGLRKNQARVRYGIWLVVSVKFLIPFSLLIGLGSNLANPHSSVGTQSGLYSEVEEVGQPFTQTTSPVHPPVAIMASGEHLLSILLELAALVWLCGFFAVLSLWWIRWRRVAAALRGAVRMEKGREVDMLRELEQIRDRLRQTRHI
jgi:bla regulator protein BlaR1